MKYTIILLALMAILMASCTGSAEKMTAEEVINKMVEAKEQQMANIEDVIIVYDNNTKYQKRALVDDNVIYRTRTEMEMEDDAKFVSIWDGSYIWVLNPMTGQVENQQEKFDASDMLHNLQNAKLKYVRRDNLNGKNAHLLDIVSMDEMMGMQELEGVSFQVWIDAEDWVVLQMQAKMLDDDEEEIELMTVEFNDYENHNGMLIAHSTVISMAGMDTVMQVEEVKVNTGLTDELFDGNSLGE